MGRATLKNVLKRYVNVVKMKRNVCIILYTHFLFAKLCEKLHILAPEASSKFTFTTNVVKLTFVLFVTP